MTRPAAVRVLALKIPQDRALALGFTFAFAMILTPSQFRRTWFVRRSARPGSVRPAV